MQTTSPYWYQEPEFANVRYIKPITRTLGFDMKIPWPAPVTVGAIYAGEGAMPDRREMNTTAFGEYYAIDNKIPASGGVALINVNEPRFQFSRDRFVYRI